MTYGGTMLKAAIPGFDEFSAAEKLQLLEELWDDLAKDPADIPVHEWQQDEMKRRYEEYLRSPAEGSSWSEVRARLLRTFQ